MFVLIPSDDDYFEVHHATDAGLSFTGLTLQREGAGWRTVADGSYSGYKDLHASVVGDKSYSLSNALAGIKLASQRQRGSLGEDRERMRTCLW